MYRVLISGWYGFGNLGDEAILYAIAKTLERDLGEVRVQALSYDPSFTGSYQGIASARQLPSGARWWLKALVKGELFRTLRLFASCQVLILGGGGFLSDWQPEAPWVWLRQALIAKLMGKQVMLYGIGAGPFTRKWGKRITRVLVNGCVDAVTVRDDESRRWLVQAGVDPAKIAVTADPALRYPVGPGEGEGRPPRQVGICIAPLFHAEALWPGKRYKFEAYRQAMREATVQLLARGFEVRFISMQENTDGAFAREIISGLHGELAISVPPGDLDGAVAQLGEVDILVTMRFHAAILGALQGIPVAAIIYHHKVAEFVDRIGLRDCAQELGDGSNWKEADLDPALLVRQIESIAADYPALRQRMLARVSALQEAERGNVRILRGLLEGKR